MFFWPVVIAITSLVGLMLSVGVTVHAVLYKRDGTAVIGWVALVWMAPFLGAFAYLCLGVNRIQRKATRFKLGNLKELIEPPPLTDEQLRMVEDTALHFPNLVGLATAVGNLTDTTLTPGNDIKPLIDGDEAYPAMINAINSAEHSVALLSYIFDNDKIGGQFVDAMAAAKARGVEVRVLVDDVGAGYSKPKIFERLKAQEIRFASFLPTKLPRIPTTANMRNHRKLLIVDGKVGFTGGTNIRDAHRLASNPGFPVQCLHFKIEGPVVLQMQRAFAIDWAFATEEVLGSKTWFPTATKVGSTWSRGIEHGPDESFERLRDVLVSAAASATHRIRIVTPYFLPREALIAALNSAALRGLEVEIYIPNKTNIPLVQWATEAQLWRLLEKGCKIYKTPEPFDHTKLMIVDDHWVLLGSTNWDPRSLRLNFEFNLECYDESLTRQLHEIVDTKAAESLRVKLDDVNNRSFLVKVRDGLARLLIPYL